MIQFSRHCLRAPCILAFLCAAQAPAFGQTCAGTPSFRYFTWQGSLGLEATEAGGLRGSTSVAGGRDALFGIALLNAGRSGGVRGASYIAGGTVGADQLIHRRRRVHLCPTVTGLYTVGPDRGLQGFVLPIETPLRIDITSMAVGAGGSIGYVAHETPTRQIVPTVSLGVMRERTRATRQAERFPDETESFLTARVGLGFVFNDQNAITPHIVMAFRDRSATSLHIVGTFGFGLR